MASKAGSWHIDILVLDFSTEKQAQGSLDQLGILGATESTQASVALITVRAGAVEFEDLVILVGNELASITHTAAFFYHGDNTYVFLLSILQGNAENALSDVRMDGCLVTIHVSVEHVLGSFDDFLIAA